MTIDKPSQKEINSEKASLYSVFQQLMAIVQFLAQLFRSSDDKYIGHKNGNFRDLVESLAKFVSVMQENIWRKKIFMKFMITTLGKRIQNELISLMGNKVRKIIAGRVKSAKYFSVMLDCPACQRHQEQTSLTIRYM